VQGTSCQVATPVDPSTRTSQEVCDAWNRGQVVEDPNGWTQGAGACDPGTLSRAFINDVLRRIDAYRYLAGLYPVIDDASEDTRAQAAAFMMWKNGTLSHTPPSSWICYSGTAAEGADSSNLEGGSSAPDSIDAYMSEGGSPQGHRRWVLNGVLDYVGVGYANKFNALEVLSGGNTLPSTTYQALPNPGPVPLVVALLPWSIQSRSVSFGSAQVTVTRKSDNQQLSVSSVMTTGIYGEPTLAITRNGWDPVAGTTYTVTITGTSVGTITYDVTPVNC
jgi:uncharacterized protein YkwD